MECGIIEPQSQYISPRLICIDTGKDQKNAKKTISPRIFKFFYNFYRTWLN